MRKEADILDGLKNNFNWLTTLDEVVPNAKIEVIPQEYGPFKVVISTGNHTYEGIGDSRTEALEDALSVYALGLSNEELDKKGLEGFGWDDEDTRDTESPRETEGSCYED